MSDPVNPTPQTSAAGSSSAAERPAAAPVDPTRVDLPEETTIVPDAGLAGDEPAEPQGDPLAPALAPDGPGAAPDDGEAVQVLAAERDHYLALAQRAHADFDNFRKRMTRESAQAMEKGAGRLASDLLPALDHLHLALKAAEAEGGELFKGVRMVQDEMSAALGRSGIEAFAPVGEPFDPNEHEAMVQRPAEGFEPGSVVEVYQPGYRINGTVLRPARVVVAA